MKLKMMCVILLYLLLLIIPYVVYAHPGRTDENGCHYCRTNCEKWGLSYGEYHCHNGGGTTSDSNSTNSSNTYNSNNSSIQPSLPQVEIKSSDNTLKTVIVDGTNITVADQMQYNTNKERVTISVETNDAKAKSKINNKSLAVGENNITINVIAEDGTEEEYELTVDRCTKTEEAVNVIVGIGLISGVCYGIYYLFKTRKKKQEI